MTHTTHNDQPAGGTAPIVRADLREGDEITVRMVIGSQECDPDFVRVRFINQPNNLHEFWVRLDTIATHTPNPRPLALGDVVNVRLCPPLEALRGGTILTIIGDKAWVAWPFPHFDAVALLENLERIS